jgi:hypothetical protein
MLPVLSVPAVAAQELYPVKLGVTDTNGQAVSGAVLQLSDYGNVVTGVSGIVQLQLKAGKYDLSVSFLSVQVFSGSITVSAPLDTAIKCAIFSVDVTLTGLQGSTAILGMAKVSGKTVTVRSTEPAAIRFPQLPKGAVTLLLFTSVGNITRLVAEKELQLDRNVVLTLAASLDYRAIDVKVLDSSAKPIGDALVKVDGDPANVTDATGRATIFARDGYHVVSVDFYGLSVYVDKSFQVWRDDSRAINASVSALEVTLVDENSNPVRGASVFLQIGTHNFTLTSDSAGVVKLLQAPYGSMAVSVLHNVPSSFVFAGSPVTVHVFTHGLSLVAEPVRAYMLGPLTVKVEVRLGEMVIKNAAVRLKRGSVAVDKGTTERGYALLSMTLGLESHVTVSVEASALGQVASQELTISTSPFIPATMPLAFIPIITFEVLRRRVRSQLRAPSYPRRRHPRVHEEKTSNRSRDSTRET